MLNKKEQRMIDKAYEKLQEAQASCTARLFDLKDIEETIFEAKKAFDGLDPIERKYLIELVTTCEHTIPVAYNWPAKTSYIEVRLNRYGTLTSILVDRISAHKKRYGGKEWRFKSKYE